MMPFKIFIGWDRRETQAYEVASFSLKRRATISTEITPIKRDDLRSRGIYWRANDPLASTEFTYSRFLTPFLAEYEGWALYCDCDFLWLADVAELLKVADPNKAVHCVQHDHRPSETTKMDGRVQSLYPRKNWSSLMLFNCAHPSVHNLTPQVVNTKTGAYLHRLQWVSDEEIGALPEEWNWLEGWSSRPASGTPKAVHFTRGGPWFEQWREVDYADLWLAEQAALRNGAA
jgi:lipopolysaccharide biosynthesis glycosyltransferase